MGLPYVHNTGRQTIMHTDTLKREEHTDADTFVDGDLRLVGTGAVGEWLIINRPKLKKS